jgi:CRISPR-associated endonuclease/helicase Cas3
MVRASVCQDIWGRLVDDIWAHSRNNAGIRHRLDDHLLGTAARARQFGEPFGAGDLAGYLGLVHDVGKGSCGWQAGLAAAEQSTSRVGTDHKMAGTWLAAHSAGVLATAVNGHHGGLPAAATLQNELNAVNADRRARWEETIEKVAALVPGIRPWAPLGWPPWYSGARAADRHVTDLLVRMVFSALVDADFLDTEAHFQGAARPIHLMTAAELPSRYEEGRQVLLERRRLSPADVWRDEVYAQAVAAAAGPTGMYRLPAPTGSGKTLAAGAFAVHHSQAHNLPRVVVAVPFISITEQNAQVYRGLLDRRDEDPVVLEHHSGADLDQPWSPGGWWRRLASENWDAPFIVTTTVQLLQSLFDHRPAAMRKLHRPARSVIVLDEVQALPDRLLLPILSVLRTLTECFGTTVLLASATQPSYWALKPFSRFPVTDVIADPKALYARSRRVRYEWQLAPKPTLQQVARQAALLPQALVVVNTTKNSALVHRSVAESRDGALGPCVHLSTRMAAQHRRDALDEIRGRLDHEQPVAVVSTQLIEAGVDVDFPVVFRAWAPADSLQQAAGRANRSARMNEGRVVIFDPEDGGRPADASYKAALAATRSHFGPDRADPDDPDALENYYPERYARQNLEAAGPGPRIQRLREHLDFPEVAAAFRMIDEQTVPVAVEYGGDEAQAEVKALVGRLRNGSALEAGEVRRLLRQLQPYLAAIPRALARKAVAAGYAEPVTGDLVHWRGPYDPRRGIDPADLSALESSEVCVW